jgi:cellulose synthase/poly-beta-1,6-N-acetylglucosamine synthase-like glycosyltransferase
LFNPLALNLTYPEKTIRGLLHQRRRWFRGGREVAWYNAALLIFTATIVPLLIASVFLLPFQWPLIFFGVKTLGDFLFLTAASLKLGLAGLMKWFIPWEIYYCIAALVTPVNTAVPSKVIWKGRKI